MQVGKRSEKKRVQDVEEMREEDKPKYVII
jgi:hypothetical protein